MAYEIHSGPNHPKIAASALAAFIPVQQSATTRDAVVLCASSNQIPFGFTLSTTATANTPVAVHTMSGDVIKAVCIASVGPGAEVYVGSTNGGLAPALTASGRWTVGITPDSAVIGDVFSVLFRPRQFA